MAEERRPCPQCGEMIMAQAVVCRFCNADFRPAPPAAPAAPPPARSGGLPVILILVIVAAAAVPVIAIVAAIAMPAFITTAREANERNAAAALKTLCAAEFDFRANDRDGNGVNDFWTGDVAGLYRIRPEGSNEPIKLIDNSLAAADAWPRKDLPLHRIELSVSPLRPKAGYLYCALTSDDAGQPYRQDTKGKNSLGAFHNPAKFAFCAYPERYPARGRQTYLVNEEGCVYRKDTGGKPVTRWPADPRAEGWQSLD